MERASDLICPLLAIGPEDTSCHCMGKDCAWWMRTYDKRNRERGCCAIAILASQFGATPPYISEEPMDA